MARYRRKQTPPPTFEAWQWTPGTPIEGATEVEAGNRLKAGQFYAEPGDYIARDELMQVGELFVIPKDTFDRLYESAPDEAPEAKE